MQQGYRVMYRETHVLLEELAEAVVGGTRKEFMESMATVPLLILDDFGMRKLPLTAAEDLLEISRQRRESPMREIGDRCIQAGSALAVRDRKAQEHAYGRALRAWSGMPTGDSAIIFSMIRNLRG